MSKSGRRKQRDYDPDDEKPMNEEQWEAFMREGDLRAARFGELLETLIDHPNRDELVAREMGWDEIADALAEEKQGKAGGEDAGEETDDFEQWKADVIAAGTEAAEEEKRQREAQREARREAGEPEDDDPFAERVPSPEELAAMPEDEWPVEAIPAYTLAVDVGMRVHEELKPWLERRADDDDEVGEKLGEAFIGVHIAGAKLAGGHGMGYEDDSICGNIVCCKKGLAGAEQTEQALLWLREEGTVPKEKVDLLLPDVRKVAEAIRQRITELRARVWWD